MLDVSGVGYLVASTPTVLRRAEGAAEITVETYLHVREDTLQLYGFADAGAEGQARQRRLALRAGRRQGERRRQAGDLSDAADRLRFRGLHQQIGPA